MDLMEPDCEGLEGLVCRCHQAEIRHWRQHDNGVAPAVETLQDIEETMSMQK